MDTLDSLKNEFVSHSEYSQGMRINILRHRKVVIVSHQCNSNRSCTYDVHRRQAAEHMRTVPAETVADKKSVAPIRLKFVLLIADTLLGIDIR